MLICNFALSLSHDPIIQVVPFVPRYPFISSGGHTPNPSSKKLTDSTIAMDCWQPRWIRSLNASFWCSKLMFGKWLLCLRNLVVLPNAHSDKKHIARKQCTCPTEDALHFQFLTLKHCKKAECISPKDAQNL